MSLSNSAMHFSMMFEFDIGWEVRQKKEGSGEWQARQRTKPQD